MKTYLYPFTPMKRYPLWKVMTLFILLAIISCKSNSSADRQAADSTSRHADTASVLAASQNNAKGAAADKPVPDTIDLSQYKEKIAPFKIRLVNGEGYTFADLEKGKETTLVYFQPDCPECQAFATELTKRAGEMPEKQIVMICFASMKALKIFDKQFQLSKHPNIHLGSEGYTFVVQQYYQINHFPFVASYSKAGKLVRILNPKLGPEVMADRL